MSKIYMNRELSWLKFNERVLEEAENPEVPLCERLTFASIYQSNLDEFFMVRVGSLYDQTLLDKKICENKTGMTSQEQIDAILKQTKLINKRKEAVYEELMARVAEQGIRILRFNELDEDGAHYLEGYFKSEIAPLISPTVIGRRQPFPFLKNKEIYAVAVLGAKGKKDRLGIIPCTSNIFGRLIAVPGMPGTYMLAEELILHFAPVVFKGYKIKSKSLLRITRNADIDADALYDEDLDYREFMAGLIKQRKKLAPIRLELSRDMDKKGIAVLCEYLELDENHVFMSSTPLDLSFVFQIQDLLRKNPELYFPKRTPQKSDQFQDGKSIIAQIKEEDKLLSYPYESIRPFLHLLTEAAEDPDVISIKMTLYRVAKQSKVVEALIEAAENGKEVVVLVELRARFDEENNIEYSRKLEEAGCRVIYGLNGYKVHSKLCLISRKTEQGVSYVTQIGTGNYNEKTSALYTDLSLITGNQEIGKEAAEVFAALLRGETVEETHLLLVAPKCLQNKVLDMIEEEIQHVKNGEEGYIGIKINSLTDKVIISKLVEASQAGVKIEMIVRGICCLIPGVKGYTENITVISIVGRFLEHSRIYRFGTKERENVYIASADFMTRNTLRRVEVAAPVLDERLKNQLDWMFETMMKDDEKGKCLTEKGIYVDRNLHVQKLNSQECFYEAAYANAEKRQK